MRFWLPGNFAATTEGIPEALFWGHSGVTRIQMFWCLDGFFIELLYIRSSQLTRVCVLHACGQILVGVQVDGDERRVFALDVAGFTGLDSVELVLPPPTCQSWKKQMAKYVISTPVIFPLCPLTASPCSISRSSSAMCSKSCMMERPAR